MSFKKHNIKLNIQNGVLLGFKASMRNGIEPFELNIPEGVTEIAPQAFYDCYRIYRITLPSTLKTIGDNAFGNCSKITEIINHSTIDLNVKDKYVQNGGIAAWAKNIVTTEDDSLLSITGDGLVLFRSPESFEAILYLGKERTVKLPDGITAIETDCFHDRNITSVTLPESIKFIGASAFAGTDISAVTLPANLSYVASKAFDCCYFLKEVTILNPKMTISADAFDHTYEFEKVNFAGSPAEWNDLVEDTLLEGAVSVNYIDPK